MNVRRATWIGYGKRITTSPWTTYAVLMGGSTLFEYWTNPWRSEIIPRPHLMFYGLAVVVCAYRGYFWGLLASLSWYVAVFPYAWLTDRTYYPLFLWQFVRLLIHFGGPLLVSWFAARLRAADRARSELLAVLSTGVSHRFNNLLMIIIGHCDFAQHTSNPAEIHDHLAVALEAAEQAASLVDNIRRHAKRGAVSPELLTVTADIQNI